MKTNAVEFQLICQSLDATNTIINKHRCHLWRGIQYLHMVIWEIEGFNNMSTSINLQERKVSNIIFTEKKMQLFYNVHCGFAGDLAMKKK